MLRFRPLRAVDVAACAALLRAEGVRGALLDEPLLVRLLAERRLVARVFEETAGAGPATVRGCGLSALIAPEAAASAAREDAGDFVDRLLASCRDAAPQLLDRARTAELNRAGRLHMVVLSFALGESDAARIAAVTAVAHSAFLNAHSGYGLDSLIGVLRPWERKAAEYRASLIAMGCRPQPASRLDGSQVFVLDAAQIARHPYHVLQGLFVRRTPQLALTAAQQDLLELACHGFDDAAIAADLGVTLHTVHKRWRAIYARVADALPGLLACPVEPAAHAGRGLEKRKRLVEYARHHPEELRPWPAPGRP